MPRPPTRPFALAVLLAIAHGAPTLARAQSDAARVETLGGRVVIVASELEVVRPERPFETRGPAHLEVGAGAEARVTWPGAAQLRIFGPASIEWSASQDGALGLTAFELGRVEALVERDGFVLRLPLGWRGELGRGAFAIGGGAGARTWIENRAGAPARFANGCAFPVRPPADVAAGQRIELGDPRAEPLRIVQQSAAPWRAVDWPFGRLEAPARPQRATPVSW